jgi:hypothetical protein
MTIRNNCYTCIYRGTIPGDCHSCCRHPDSGLGGDNSDPMLNLIAIFASVGRCAPITNLNGAKKLQICGDPHGIRNGWFNWPYNFDPTWLKSCNGFLSKEETEKKIEQNKNNFTKIKKEEII